MKMEWLVTNVTNVGPSDGSERAILGVILAGPFFLNQVSFVVREQLCGVTTLS